MSARPNDGLMNVADAVGVNATPGATGYCPRHTICPTGCPDQRIEPLHPSVRAHLADEVLAAHLDAWADETPIPYELDTCPLCDDTGLYETTSAIGGGLVHVTCPVCPSEHHDPDGDRW